MYRFEIFASEMYGDLETRVRGHSSLLENGAIRYLLNI